MAWSGRAESTRERSGMVRACHATAWWWLGQGDQGAVVQGEALGCRDAEGSRGARVGLGPLSKTSMGSNLDYAHKVFVKMAERKYFQILEIFLVDCIHILFEVEWWWWWSIWCRFARFQNGVNLFFISMSPLVTSILVNLVKVSSGGQQQSGSP